MIKNIRRFTAVAVALVYLVVGAGSAAAEEQQHPWTHPDVLRAMLEIRMTEEQRPQFRETVTEFLQGFNGDVQKLLRANNQSGLPRKIASKRRSRAKQMDAAMAEFLTEEQVARYEIYRDQLLEKMDEQAAARRR